MTDPAIVLTMPLPCDSRDAHDAHRWTYQTGVGQTFDASCKGSTYGHTDPYRVMLTATDDAAPLSGQTVSGYGRRIPTRHRVYYRGTDGRGHWHRVYVMSYGNMPSPYITVRGVVHFLDTDTESELTR